MQRPSVNETRLLFFSLQQCTQVCTIHLSQALSQDSKMLSVLWWEFCYLSFSPEAICSRMCNCACATCAQQKSKIQPAFAEESSSASLVLSSVVLFWFILFSFFVCLVSLINFFFFFYMNLQCTVSDWIILSYAVCDQCEDALQQLTSFAWHSFLEQTDELWS